MSEMKNAFMTLQSQVRAHGKSQRSFSSSYGICDGFVYSYRKGSGSVKSCPKNAESVPYSMEMEREISRIP